MRKLVKYLKAYEDYKSKKFWRWNYIRTLDKETWVITAIRFPDGSYICEDESRAIIICRGYNFIKWLVDNDKIDRDKTMYENWKFRRFYFRLEVDTNRERLIAWLSIQYSPIEFLCSVIK